MQKKSFGEKLRKLWRGLMRELLGESNRIVVPMVMSHYSAAPISATSIPNPDNRLQYEDSKLTIEGKYKDVHRVRCLDNMIGSLSQSFNEKAKKKIERHIADVADSLQRISAYKIAEDKQKLPMDCLEYSKDGQLVAKIKLG